MGARHSAVRSIARNAAAILLVALPVTAASAVPPPTGSYDCDVASALFRLTLMPNGTCETSTLGGPRAACSYRVLEGGRLEFEGSDVPQLKLYGFRYLPAGNGAAQGGPVLQAFNEMILDGPPQPVGVCSSN